MRGPRDRRRGLWWLVAVPTGSGFAVWAVLLVETGPEATRTAIAGFLPLLGLLAVVAYAWSTGDRVNVLPFVPFALAAVLYVPLMVQFAIQIQREPDGAFIPVFELGLGFLMPFLALGGGCASLAGVGDRNGNELR